MEHSDALAELERRISQRKFHSFQPYDFQREFFAGGSHELQRMLMAANRVGKTLCAAFETTCHATGLYPDWWTGFKIKGKVPSIMVSSLTNTTSRDIIQKELLGEVGDFGTGMIPKDLIVDVKFRQAGIPDVADVILVRHVSGKVCEIKTKVAEAGWKKYQGTERDFIWQDEEPDHFKVVSECFMRLVTTRGRYIVTFTPLQGETQLVQHFQENTRTAHIYTATWDDAPHLTEETKEQFLAGLPIHEREARAKGIPMMGEGALFPVSDEHITCDPFPIPDHFFRIAGVDYGVSHRAAGAWIAWDVDQDTIYLYDEYAIAGQLPPYHASAIRRRDPEGWIPVVGPHDGLNEEKGSGQKVANEYAREGVNMLSITACYDNKRQGPQPIEPIVMEIHQRFVDGRLKIFSTCQEFMKEKRGLHRKEGKIVALKDDVFKALCYAIMTKRYAAPKYYHTKASRKGGAKPMIAA